MALRLTVATSVNSQFSKTKIAVIIFVVLAGYLTCLAFFSYRIFPELASIKIQEGEYTEMEEASTAKEVVI